jgi:hypothetical protein
MRKLSGMAAVVGGMILVPAAAFAQGMAMPHHEFGVDLGVVYHSISAPAGGNSVTGFGITTPVDVRVGFVSQSAMSFEGRLALSYQSLKSGGVSFSAYTVSPDINILFKLGAGTGHHNMMGPYLTAGVGATFAGVSDGSSTSGSNVTFNAGVGTRTAFGSGAWRYEGFVAYTLKNTDIGPIENQLSIGVRVGLSLWH